MNKKLLYTLFITPFLIFAFYNTSYSKKNDVPAGSTGAPGENSCGSGTTGCHFKTAADGCGTVDMEGFLEEMNKDLKLTFGSNEISSSFKYKADSTYEMTFEILNPNVNGGFSMTTLNSDDAFVGSFTTVSADTNVVVKTHATNSRDYVGHKHSLDLNSWTFNWTAPAVNTGDITFYASANKANGAVGMFINSCGDTIIPFKMTITEDVVSRINTIDFKTDISILSNPINSDKIVFETIVKEPKRYFVTVYDLFGKKISYKEQVLHTGIKTLEIPLTQKGIFILNIVTDKNEIANYKIIN